MDVRDKRVGAQRIDQGAGAAEAPATDTGGELAQPASGAAEVVRTRLLTRPVDAARVVGDVPPATPPTAAAPTGPPPTLREAFDALPSLGGGPARSRLLSGNLDSWNARWEMLEGATRSIDAVYFSLERDVYGFAMLGFLLKKQLEGVPVRVMTDAMADTFGQRGFKMPLRGKDYLQELANHGARAYIYHPIWQRPIDALRFDYSILASNHDKLLAVDGERGITGGRNIGIDYFSDPVDRPWAWRDLDLAVEGADATAGLSRALDVELEQERVSRRVKPDRLGNWVKRDVELIGAYLMMDLWLKDPPLGEPDKARLRQDPAARAALADELVERALARLPQELPEKLRRQPKARERKKLRQLADELVGQLEARGSRHRYQARRSEARAGEAKIIDQTSAAGERINGIAPALLSLVESAQKRIVIENPYVVLTEQMVEALERASARGVEIEIITNSPLSTDSATTQAFFLEDWAYILARCPTARIFVATGERKFHGKSAVIDDELSLVTTYNMDLLSGYVNSEVGAVMRSPELARDLLQAFTADRDNPAYGFLEYQIERGADGEAVLDNGQPVVVFGPEDHLPAEVLEAYRKKRQLWGRTLRDNVPYFEPLRHPPLEPGD